MQAVFFFTLLSGSAFMRLFSFFLSFCFLILTRYLYHFENLENAHTPRPDPSV